MPMRSAHQHPTALSCALQWSMLAATRSFPKWMHCLCLHPHLPAAGSAPKDEPTVLPYKCMHKPFLP